MQDSREQRLAGSMRLAIALHKLGYSDQAENVAQCGRFYSVFLCPNCGNERHTVAFSCDHRLCPQCARVKAAKMVKELAPVTAKMVRPKFVTLTLRSVPARNLYRGGTEKGKLSDAMKQLWGAFTRLRHRRIWSRVGGCIASMDVTFNAADRTWHPHLHLVIDGPYIPQEMLKNEWSAANRGAGEVVDIRQCSEGWERELVKYICGKSMDDVVSDPDALRELVKAVRCRKMLRTYGSCRGREKLEAEEDGDGCCKECGSPMVFVCRITAEDEFKNARRMGTARAVESKTCRGSP